jgi:hypothetical protein
MAQAGYTPISLYYSTTAAASPAAGDLVAGELALNTNLTKSCILKTVQEL